MPTTKKSTRLDLTKKHDTMTRSDYAAQIKRAKQDLEKAIAIGDVQRQAKCQEILKNLESGHGRAM